MARYLRHVSVNIGGMLRNYKKKSMAGFFQDEKGRYLSDEEARKYLAECQAKGWKKIPCNAECEGFDYFDKGCPGHEVDNNEKPVAEKKCTCNAPYDSVRHEGGYPQCPVHDKRPEINHDQVIVNQVAGMPLEEAIYQTGYTSGHDAGYEKGKREAQQGAHIRKESVEEEWDSLWKHIVTNEDGTINIEQVKKELADFSFVMEQVPKVYCYITGQRMSKVMYHADTVIAVADDHFKETLDEAVRYEVGERISSAWVNLATNYTEDWQTMHCRFAIDKYKLDTDLFEEKDGGLVKKGGTGRVEFREVEYLVESGTAMEKDKEIENLKTEIERRNKIMEENLKIFHRINTPGISEQEQECAWQMYKLKNNL